MIQSLHLQKLRISVLLSVVGFLAVSCGSYQQASYYDNDGIYSDGNTVAVERAPRTKQQPEQQRGNDIYGGYFEQKADQYDQILDSEIFTDVDSYTSGVVNDSINEADLTDYYSADNDYAGNGAWGDNPTSVNINIYDNGWNNWGMGG
ncbi:Vitellogenin II precursor, partial [hydrothermal vent metagenome]